MGRNNFFLRPLTRSWTQVDWSSVLKIRPNRTIGPRPEDLASLSQLLDWICNQPGETQCKPCNLVMNWSKLPNWLVRLCIWIYPRIAHTFCHLLLLLFQCVMLVLIPTLHEIQASWVANSYAMHAMKLNIKISKNNVIVHLLDLTPSSLKPKLLKSVIPLNQCVSLVIHWKFLFLLKYE